VRKTILLAISFAAMPMLVVPHHVFSENQAPEPIATKSSASPACKYRFSVTTKDLENNITQGLPSEYSEWFEQKVRKKYPDICYVAPGSDAPIMFFITLAPYVYAYRFDDPMYEMRRSDPNGTVPPESDDDLVDMMKSSPDRKSPALNLYDNNTKRNDKTFTLTVAIAQAGGTWKLSRRFYHGAYWNLVPGVPPAHPAQDVLRDTAKWLHNSGLNN